MPTKFHTLLIVLRFTMISCAGSPAMIRNASPDELKTVSTLDLIRGYNFLSATTPFSKWEPKSRTPNVKAELKNRNLVPDHEWESIDRRAIKIGMSEMGLYISWGFPTKTNKTVSSSGTRKQCIYDNREHARDYVYIENGKITSWQN
jgi:hypothetical protein